ncbi:MAG: hypothetical protein Q8K89_11500, partial [Actinomycetota bacterium]|nr:hypothetical protein [Actinomycetota bacterium]
MRLAVGYVTVVTLFALAWAWSLFTPLTAAVVAQQTRSLLAVAHAAALTAERGSPLQQLAETLAEKTALRVTIVAADGAVLADSAQDPARMENHATRPEIVAALDGRTGEARRVSKTQGAEELYVAVGSTLPSGDRVAVRISEPVAHVDDAAAASRRTGLLLLLAVLAVASVIAWRLTAVTAEPVQLLSRAAQAMA